jgi:GT2 family glycosyltransferase
MQTPIAFIIFNRPDTTEKVFEAIRQAKPPLLLVIADGARTSKLGEAEKCAATRAIIDRVDWDCEVRTNYSEVNLGCGKRVSSGIDWVFQEVEEAIILEDDCLPHPTFFQFCEELLEYYRDDSRIMAISGNNFQRGRKHSEDSYYFSRYNHVWGWASWRRAWKHYDFTMSEWPQVRDGNWLNSVLDNRELSEYWTVEFEKTHRGEVDTWDYQWTFACWIQNSLTILPQVNLISNIGFNADATHTNKHVPWASQSIYPIDLPLIHPSFMLRNAVADFSTANIMYQSNLFKKAINKVKFILSKW